MSFTSYLWGRNLGITHFFFSSFMAVGSFLGERRALSPGRRNSIMYKELDSFSHGQTIVVKTTSEIVDTFLLYQTIQPPELWIKKVALINILQHVWLCPCCMTTFSMCFKILLLFMYWLVLTETLPPALLLSGRRFLPLVLLTCILLVAGWRVTGTFELLLRRLTLWVF